MAEGGYTTPMAGLEDDLMMSSSSGDSDDHQSTGMEGDAEFQEVISKAEKKGRRDPARLSEDSDSDEMISKKKFYWSGRKWWQESPATLYHSVEGGVVQEEMDGGCCCSVSLSPDTEDEEEQGINQGDGGCASSRMFLLSPSTPHGLEVRGLEFLEAFGPKTILSTLLSFLRTSNSSGTHQNFTTTSSRPGMTSLK
ncbi:hypothetical protein O3P69_007525 [Scylla paramamosain]|uniref:Uncharacterized protein n=1 Tax=Scylla paramamosain TaxID=85552 RepID=A0AAW0V7U6_SCYPA